MTEKQNGFTLVEIVVSIVLIGVLSTTVILMFVSIQRIQTAALFQESAHRGAARQIEILRSKNYSDILTGTTNVTTDLPTVLPASKEGLVTITETQPGLKKVEVTISYDLYSREEQVRLTTYIAEIGITQ